MHSLERRELTRQRLRRLQASLVDHDCLVDEYRRDVTVTSTRLQVAVERRDRVADELKELIDRLEVAA